MNRLLTTADSSLQNCFPAHGRKTREAEISLPWITTGQTINRLLTTAEASTATGVSEYELRKGAAEGRYPVILLGNPANKFRKMRWNLETLTAALMRQGGSISP